MSRRQFKPGNMLYPVPAVMVTAADKEGNSNIFTVAWAGTVCSDPPMLSISVRPERFSYHMIKETGEFVVNLTTEALAWATDFCGVRSGRDTDKWKETGLTKEKASIVSVPLIRESPVNLECRVTKVEELGTHHMFLAEVVSVDVNEEYLDEKDTFHLWSAKPLAYSHGRYYGLGECLGTFGYSVRKPVAGKRPVHGAKTAVHRDVTAKKRPVTGKKSAAGKNPETGMKSVSHGKTRTQNGRKKK